jgi:hypothetical protein
MSAAHQKTFLLSQAGRQEGRSSFAGRHQKPRNLPASKEKSYSAERLTQLEQIVTGKSLAARQHREKP